jgi:hypothetical protein
LMKLPKQGMTVSMRPPPMSELRLSGEDRGEGIDSIAAIESILSPKIFTRAPDGPSRTECVCCE